MTRAPMLPLLLAARSDRYAVGAFNVVTLESAEAIVVAAERLQAPVILQVSQNTVTYHGALAPIGRACVELAASAAVPVAVHLDHATTLELCEEAAELGFGSVMFDASATPLAENVASTRQVVVWAHSVGIGVEAELGVVGGKAGAPTPGTMTDPDQAARFVALSGVDALAVAVGTSHHMVTTDARLDISRIHALRTAVGVPLVLHGSSGVDDANLALAVAAGISKVNMATQLNQAFSAGVRRILTSDTHDPRLYLDAGREAMATAVADKITVIGSAGRAATGGMPSISSDRADCDRAIGGSPLRDPG